MAITLVIAARRKKAAATGSEEACEVAKVIIVDAEVPCETRTHGPAEKT
jgi:hypothetical protein